MSFSSKVKEELSKLENLNNKENVKQELIGYLLSSNTSIIKNKIKFSTESEYNINRLAKLLNNCQIVDYKIEIQDKTFIITFKQKDLEEKLSQYLNVNENILILQIEELQVLKIISNEYNKGRMIIQSRLVPMNMVLNYFNIKILESDK